MDGDLDEDEAVVPGRGHTLRRQAKTDEEDLASLASASSSSFTAATLATAASAEAAAEAAQAAEEEVEEEVEAAEEAARAEAARVAAEAARVEAAATQAAAAAIAAAAAAMRDARAEAEGVTVSVRRGAGGLGLVVSPQNVVLELTAGGAAAEDGQLRIGDTVLTVDGVPLAGRRLREALRQRPSATSFSLAVRRSAPAAPLAAWGGDDGPALAAALPPSSSASRREKARRVSYGESATGVPTVLLTPTGTRFKTLLDVSRLESAAELCDLAAATWHECTGVGLVPHQLRVSPRVE